MQQHYGNLQALRGIASLLVVLLHVWGCEKRFGVETLIFREIQWFGNIGVDLFFVLSGFIIATTNRRNMGDAASVPVYLWRRLWRIYPLYWIAVIACLLVTGLCHGNGTLRTTNLSWWAAWLTLFPISEPNYFAGQAWTLTFEMMFYLVFAVVLCLPPRFGAGLLGAWAVAIGVGLLFPEPTNIPAQRALDPFVLEFLGGCVIAWLASRGVNRGGRIALVAGIVYCAVAVAIAKASLPVFWLDYMTNDRIRTPVYGPAAVLVVYGFVAREGAWRIPTLLLRLGDASYSLYMMHPVVLGLAMFTGYYIPHSRVPHFLWMTGTLATCLVAGLLTHRFVERPLLNLWRAKKPKSETTPDRQPARIAA